MDLIKRVFYYIKRRHPTIEYNVTRDDYDANKYWNDRHDKYGIETLKGVGFEGKSEDENYAEYEDAKHVFTGLLNSLNLLSPNKVLELGYGTGFYTKILNTLTAQYTGIDIVDTHKNSIKKQVNNNFTFLKGDVGKKSVEIEGCDLIYMIDVTQHIVNNDKLDFCLRNNVQNNMMLGGVFIVTDELSDKDISFYEKTRSVNYYLNVLDKCELARDPIQFRDKYIFAFKRVK
jgi:SAM-dependent methyltransferase